MYWKGGEVDSGHDMLCGGFDSNVNVCDVNALKFTWQATVTDIEHENIIDVGGDEMTQFNYDAVSRRFPLICRCVS